MKKVFLALMAVAAIALTGCEKNDPKQSHEAVDLGLPSGTKWATCNVGANKPEEFGGYFAWGETSPKEKYDASTYFDTKDDGKTFVKYNNDGGKTILEPADDAAQVNWGGSWRMPTLEEVDELCTKCTWTLIEKNGIKGYEAEGPNGNKIFLPIAGRYRNSSINSVGSIGVYWATSLYSDNAQSACGLGIVSPRVSCGQADRCYGFSIRPVCK